MCVSASELTLRVEGVPNNIADNVRGFLSIQSLENQQISSVSRLMYLHRRAEDEIRQALEPFGYYNPELDLALQSQDGGWRAVYRITLGPQTQITRVDVQIQGEGEQDPAFMALLSSNPLKTGEALYHPTYESFKSQIQSLAAERGYYLGRFTEQRIRVDRERNRAEISLTFNTGQRTRISELRFSENPIKDSLLRRYPRFEEGDFLEVVKLIDLQGALIDSDYFADVEVRPVMEEFTEGSVPVEVNLTPRPRSLYQAGFGFGTDTGARMQLGLNRRYVNSSGHKIDARMRLSEIRNDITAGYIIPGHNPRFDQFGLRTGFYDENSKTIDSSRLSFGGFWQKQIDEWEGILSLDLEQERFSFDQDTTQTRLLIPRLQMTKTVSDNRFNTQKGYRISFGVAAASEALLSDVSLLQLSASGKRVDSLGERWRLLSSVEVGTTYTSDFDRVPATLRFYAGGDNSIRGYDYQTLGPKSRSGQVIGGQHLITGSLEVDYEFIPNWRLAGFVDAGNAFDDLNEKIKTSAGFGVRWQSPVGPVRLDLATPIQDSGVRIHFTLGPDL
ncbi:outer membrane protein assembly factor [Nitrincola tibetensis]|uniref:Translocation and assembly module subunit TamA n=1 Tax=Nitrincola tibetensis TaxID=2219697 RepID=A0A364NQF8_9GAMM|nr:outer membrane protein assembly factor [Nitrincola tibetensis]